VSRTTTVILCRHGESEGNRERRFGGHGPTPLTERGRAQARATGRLLTRSGVDAIYTSDLARAAETAALIGAQLGITPRATDALRERSVGELTGLTFEEAHARFPEIFAALMRREPHNCPPGGETYVQCRMRAAGLLEQVLREHAGRRVLLVSHNVALYQLMLHVLGLGDETAAPRIAFQIDNCALHRFEHLDNGLWKVVALNEAMHLESV
jgi:probable phosphoglycerate mutase